MLNFHNALARFRMIFLLLFGSIGVSTQSPIGDACAKAALKAVETIDKEPMSDEARAAFNTARRECFVVKQNEAKENEFTAFVLVDTFKTRREHGPMPSWCIDALVNAFGHNLTPNPWPESCFEWQWDDFEVAWNHNWR